MVKYHRWRRDVSCSHDRERLLKTTGVGRFEVSTSIMLFVPWACRGTELYRGTGQVSCNNKHDDDEDDDDDDIPARTTSREV